MKTTGHTNPRIAQICLSGRSRSTKLPPLHGNAADGFPGARNAKEFTPLLAPPFAAVTLRTRLDVPAHRSSHLH
jgi:hypothetical protein